MCKQSLKIVYLTPGAGGMLCGSCLSDNMLAAAMQRLGHEVRLVPLYTPLTTDEPDVSIGKLFFGGINVYLQEKIPLFRSLPRFLDRPLDQPRLVSMFSRLPVGNNAEQLGALALSMVRGQHGHQRKEVRRLVDWLARGPRPDVINLSNLLIAGCAPTLKRELGIPMVVTLQGDDVFIDGLPPSYRKQVLEEMVSLTKQIDRFVVHSRFYAEKMSDYFRIPSELFETVPLGIQEKDFLAPGRPAARTGPPAIGYLARICPAKGLHLLVEAFLKLKQLPNFRNLRLDVAGYLSKPDRPYFERQCTRIEQAGWDCDFHYAGQLDLVEKVAFLRRIDLFSVPTTYQDPKGRFVLEALASGVPVVQPAHGAFPELLERIGGGRLFDPENTDALAAELANLLTDHPARRALAQQGPLGVKAAGRAEDSAIATLAVYENLRES
jgi:glycosyltransferase involved in cell wall biosynthesis